MAARDTPLGVSREMRLHEEIYAGEISLQRIPATNVTFLWSGPFLEARPRVMQHDHLPRWGSDGVTDALVTCRAMFRVIDEKLIVRNKPAAAAPRWAG